MSLLVQPGLSVLITDVMELDPTVNLLPGANVYYSAYPAADGKVGIYTRWSGEGGAEQAVTGIRHGVAPCSPTWSKAVNVLKDRYRQYPPASGIMSVLVVPDDNNDVAAPDTIANAVDLDAGAFGGVMDLLNALPMHVLEAACKRRPGGEDANITPCGTATSPMSVFIQPQVPVDLASKTRPLNNINTKTKTVSATPTAQSSANANANSNTKTSPPSTPLKQWQSSTASVVNSDITRLMSSRLVNPPHTPRVNTSSTLQTHIRIANSATHAPTTTVRTRIDSPLRGVGIAHFIAPIECYVMGHWTRTILEFIGCNKVIPIVEQRLCSSAYDEDDVELQALLAEDLSVELSHLIVKFLKLDAFLKGLGRAG